MLLNKSVREDTVKYFSRMFRKLVHSSNICFTVSGIPQDWQVGGSGVTGRALSDERLLSYTDDDLVHESVDVRPFELGPAAVHHELGVSSGEQHQSVAPGRVAQHTAAQKHLLVVQRIRLIVPRQRALELAQIVVRRLAQHFTYPPRSHDHELPNRTHAIKDCSFLIRLLYDCWLSLPF